MNKKISLFWLYAKNGLLFLAFVASTSLIKTRLEIGYLFLVLLVLCGFETMFFYKKSDRSFAPISADQSLEVVLMSVGATVILGGSILFILAIR